MAVVHLSTLSDLTQRRSPSYLSQPQPVADTIEVGSDDSANSTYTLNRIYLLSNAIILPQSVIQIDDLASTGSPTLDIGLKGDHITDDPDAINDGIDAATAGKYDLIKDPALWGAETPLWDYVAGLTSDPGGFFELYVSLVDAAVNVGGTMSVSLFFKMP